MLSRPDVAAVLLVYDPAVSEGLAATLSAIAPGEPAPRFSPLIITETANRADIPPAIVDHVTALEILPCAIDVIWLSAQGLDNKAIGQVPGITETTVNSRWRNIGAPRGLTRKQACFWAREEVRRVRGEQYQGRYGPRWSAPGRSNPVTFQRHNLTGVSWG